MNNLQDKLTRAAEDLKRGVTDPGQVAAIREAAEELEKPHNIPSQMEKIVEQFCDHYCKWPERCQTEDELYANYCNDCPTGLLL